MGHRRRPQVDRDLDEIWLYVASQSGNPEVADRLIERITDRILLLETHPYLGRPRDSDLRHGIRTFAVVEYVIFYRVEDGDAVILRVLQGRRDLSGLLE